MDELDFAGFKGALFEVKLEPLVGTEALGAGDCDIG